MSDTAAPDVRVLALAPTARDGDLCRTILAEAGVGCLVCPTVEAVCQAAVEGAGAVVLTEEALAQPEFAHLASLLAAQPPWSDLATLVLTRAGAASEVALRTLELLGNVTLLERPIRVPAFVSAVRAALRARRRQYQIRAHLAEAARLNATLQDGDRRKDEFLAMLAHELRNPLAPIRNGLAILDVHGSHAPEAVEVRRMMGRQVEHLVRLVDDLLDVSRSLQGKIDLQVEPLDLAAVVGRAVEMVRPTVDEQQHALIVALPPGRVVVDGDAVRLAQVFANLLHNAAKYTEAGGRIAVYAERAGPDVVVRIRDTGVGIAADLLPRVFDLFTQADRSLARSQGGLGLGLTLVKRLVEMHCGAVSASSGGIGAGSEFAVRLPARFEAAPAVPAVPAPAVAPAAVAGRRVLVVDDNEDAAETLAYLLRLGGHDVRTAHRGRAALELATAFAPDAVLLDIGLPDLTGYEVARRLRQQRGAGPLLVAITGYGQENDRTQALAAGFDQHFVKPVDPAALGRLIAGRVV